MKLSSLILCAGTASLCGFRALAQTSSPDSAPGNAVVITASALGLTPEELAQPAGNLYGDELTQKLAPTLGDTLHGEPGVAASGFTAGASRPIIRGLSENRVRVLNNGTEVFDVSNLSPDHAPSVDAAVAQNIEVVRGPATILYGSGAIGGLVNVVDRRIPMSLPTGRLSGEVDARFNTADLERSSAVSLDVGVTDHLVLHLDGSILRTDDVAIPGYALVPRIRGELPPEQRFNGFGGDPHGLVPNTKVFTRDFAIGLSWVGERGYFGVSYARFLSYYDSPDDPEVDDPTAAPDRVHLDVRKDQFNARGSLKDPLPGFSTAQVKVVYTDYRHDEIDTDVIGSTFKTSGLDSRVELVHQPLGIFTGALGVQGFYRSLSVLGADAFLQPTDTTQLAAFLFEEAKLAPVRLQFGIRVEHQWTSIDTSDPALTSLTSSGEKQRDFTPVSAALGAIYDLPRDLSLAFTASYSERAPTPEELFARGPHDATFQYLVGDPLLGTEKCLGLDLSLRKQTGVLTGSLSAFYNRFRDFIEFTPTGQTIDDLQVFDYAPKRADFYGGEALLDLHLLPPEVTRPLAPPDGKSVRSVVAHDPGTERVPNPNDLYLELKGDYVHAEDRATGDALPRIPPLRATGAVVWQGEHLGGRVEVERVDRQSRVAEFETETAGYTFLNASLSYRFDLGPLSCDAYLRGSNLTNAEARNHESFLKDVLPLPGRSLTLGLRTTF